MPQLTIDGTVCEFEHPADGPKKSILNVALDAGVEIPHYCYHDALSVVASCRICLAEVESPNPKKDGALELIPKLVPTCQTPAADGMVVHCDSPKSLANQKAIMEYLLINHPLDCPVCDQAGECLLQDYSYRYGRGQSRFNENKIKQPKKDLGPNVLLYSDRCIMCSRCVRFTKEISGTNEIGVFGRGSAEQIDVFPGRPLDNELSGNVVDICPVGALLDKDFLMTMRVWNLQRSPTIDGLTASGDNLSVQHRDGQIYRVKPRTNMDVNQWWTSDEIRYGWKFVHHPDRLRTPTYKVHGAHEECDWNRAYKLIVDGLKRTVRDHGQGSVAVAISPMLPCEEAYLLGKLVLEIDPDAKLGVGPVPFRGEDKQFPGGYTVYAEKAPNARGVRRALSLLTDDVLAFDDLLNACGVGSGQSAIRAVLLTGNYPSDWATRDVHNAVEGKFIVVIDTLPSRLTERADVVLPGATWVEKAGTFENVNGRRQAFPQAIPAIELAKPEGQIALDLLGLATGERAGRYDAAAVRTEMGDDFGGDEVHLPPSDQRTVSEVEYVEL